MKDSGAMIDKIKKNFIKKQSETVEEEIPAEVELAEEEERITVKEVITVLGRVLFRLRKVFMSVPVV